MYRYEFYPFSVINELFKSKTALRKDYNGLILCKKLCNKDYTSIHEFDSNIIMKSYV